MQEKIVSINNKYYYQSQTRKEVTMSPTAQVTLSDESFVKTVAEAADVLTQLIEQAANRDIALTMAISTIEHPGTKISKSVFKLQQAYKMMIKPSILRV